MTSGVTMSKNGNWKKMKNPRFYRQKIIIFSTQPSSPWAILATWFQIGVF
jgi:hypothetical protein